MNNPFYILNDENEPIPASDSEGYAFISNFERRIVAQTTIGEKYFVSTVFLVIDHNFEENEKPLLFETMVFDPDGKAIDLSEFDIKTDNPFPDLEPDENNEIMNFTISLFKTHRRYHTWDGALRGHNKIVKIIQEAMNY